MASLGVRFGQTRPFKKMDSSPMDPQLVGHQHAHAYVSSALIDCLFACADKGFTDNYMICVFKSKNQKE